MRLLSLVAATGLVTTALVTTAPAAQAAGTCSLYAPSKLGIGSSYRAVTLKQGPNCAAAHVETAFWSAVHPSRGELEQANFFDGARTTRLDLNQWTVLGPRVWRGDLAADDHGETVPQYNSFTDIRLASYGRVTATRSGGKVNVKTTAMRWWQNGSKFIGWSGARGRIQWRTPGSSTWHALKDVYSNASGGYSYTYPVSTSREYRVVLNAVPTIWDSTSPVVKR